MGTALADAWKYFAIIEIFEEDVQEHNRNASMWSDALPHEKTPAGRPE